MQILLISTFTLALYAGSADGQPPAAETSQGSAEMRTADETATSGRAHARAAQRMARARHDAGRSAAAERPSGGLPVTETVVNQPPAAPDPDR